MGYGGYVKQIKPAVKKLKNKKSIFYMVEVQGQMRHVHIDHLILGPNGEDITVETLGEDAYLPVDRQYDNMEPPHVDNHPGPPPRRNPRRL